MSRCHQCQRDPDEYDAALRRLSAENERLRGENAELIRCYKNLEIEIEKEYKARGDDIRRLQVRIAELEAQANRLCDIAEERAARIDALGKALAGLKIAATRFIKHRGGTDNGYCAVCLGHVGECNSDCPQRQLLEAMP